MEKYSSLSKELKLPNSKNKENIKQEPIYSEIISQPGVKEFEPTSHLLEKNLKHLQGNSKLNYQRYNSQSVADLKPKALKESSCRESIELHNTIIRTKNILK